MNEKVAKLYDPNRKAELVVYNMERIAIDCVRVFCELSGYAQAHVGTAPTKFLDESKDPLIVIEEPATTGTKGQDARPKSAVPPQWGAGSC